MRALKMKKCTAKQQYNTVQFSFYGFTVPTLYVNTVNFPKLVSKIGEYWFRLLNRPF